LAEELKKALTQMSFHVGLKPRFETLLAHSAMRDYRVLVGNGIAAKETATYLQDNRVSHAIVVTDSNVDGLHRETFIEAVRREARSGSVAFDTIVIKAGEPHKQLETLRSVLEGFAEHGASRTQTAIVALGGGVVTDIAGLAANLYHRGLALIHIPTTLLAQVDAAIGGKTGIDAFGAKNSLGTFYPPSAVIVDPLFLQTLPRRELNAGLAELLKYGLIGNVALWQRLSKSIVRLMRGIDAEYPLLISEAIREKLNYVERDEFERTPGVRELLNFGHTFGHALEAATGFSVYLHGEAVLIGMRTAACLSWKLGQLSEAEFHEIEDALRQVPVDGKARVSTSQLLAALAHDKKRSATPRFVLLRKIGDAYVTAVPDHLITISMEYLQTLV
jgi:3-dehydroquinate synthase